MNFLDDETMSERLRRLESGFQRLPIYFVTACTNERQPILNNVATHKRFVEFGKTGGNHGAWLGAYVLMPNHLHAFVVIDDERLPLSAWMKSLKNTLSKTLKAQGVAPPHWQKGFFDHILRSSESYSAKWNAWAFVGEIFDLEYKDDRV